MPKLSFQGTIPGSKSIFNRILIVQSYFPSLDIQGESSCDDVVRLRDGLEELGDRSRIDCGDGGTTFRFMALRASRVRGRHTLMGTKRLMERPQRGLLKLLTQLGVQAQIKGKELFIISDGWKKPKIPLQVDTSESSQYASALVLNSWLLDFDLEFELYGSGVSESYFEMTMKLMKDVGLRFQKNGVIYRIPKGERISHLHFEVESDLSSSFTIAAAGALSGEVALQSFPTMSDQPDRVFIDIFKKMNVEYQLQDRVLKVHQSPLLKAVDWNLSQAPDLFPVLAVLCSYASGSSRLFGAPHLAHKESNRIAKVAELLSLVGVEHEVLEDGMVIHGQPQLSVRKGLVFNPDHDHRMVMAATLFKLKGHGIQIQDSQVINKSFPEFWKMIGVAP